MISKFIDSDALREVYFGNAVIQYLDALFYFLIALVILFVVQKALMARFAHFAQKTATEIDDVVLEFIQSIRPRLYIVLAAYIAARTLDLNAFVQNIFDVVVIVIIIFQITRSLQVVIEFGARKIGGEGNDEHVRSAAHLLGAIATILVWIFGIMMILSNVGVNITSLVAGVGVGGIAIAFAVKELLADLFSSFVIYFDQPFKVGDTVKFGAHVGKVKKIGIKTTRIQTRSGEELIVANQDITSARVQNYKKMEQRTVKSLFDVDADTPKEKLEKIPEEIARIIAEVENAECKRSHFKGFSDRGLTFEYVYAITSDSYMVYMDAQQKISFDIKEFLERLDVELAEPRQVDAPAK